MYREIHIAGRPFGDIYEPVARYCGVPLNGNPPEIWAFPYYDLIEVDGSDRLSSLDVVASAAMQPRISREDYGYFGDHRIRDAWSSWLRELPEEAQLGRSSLSTVAHLQGLFEVLQSLESPNAHTPSLSLLTKVLHRRRPHLIPIFDRSVVDFYRPVTRQRGEASWPLLVEALDRDLSEVLNYEVLERIAAEVMDAIGQRYDRLSALRCLDIAVWMKWNEREEARRSMMGARRGPPRRYDEGS
jgi:Family of unknown function (DUF6308)